MSEVDSRAPSLAVERALAAKGAATVSLCFPCRNEAATIGGIVGAARRELVERVPFVDELVVLDDRSTDDTAWIAEAAGARVVPIEDAHRLLGPGRGKGNALWCALAATTGELVVFCDGDLETFEPWWIAALVQPLLDHPDVQLVKPQYHRPTDQGGGGRTTELVARPLLSLTAPGLATLHQPLAGETAGRRQVLEAIPFVEGWGVEIALLLDVAARYGAGAIAEVDLGVRRHRHQELTDLALQAAEVLATGLARAGTAMPEAAALLGADGGRRPLQLAERPPLRDVRGS
jgi:glucosyl-3-phosphoglycerate synthase